jgi:membrane protein YdbS with pleckstrin-like domain
VRWRSESVTVRLPFRRFWSFLTTRKGVGLVTLEPVPTDELDPEVLALVLREINEQVYAQVRHHWIRRLVGVAWLVVGVPTAFVLFLLATPDGILLVTFLAAAWAVVAVRRRDKPVVVATAVAGGAGFLLVAGPYHEHIHLVPLLLLVACIARGAWLLMAYRRDLFVVTDHRVLRLWGILFKNRAVVPLGRILDITVHKPLVGRLLHYGHLVFESAAQEQGLRDVRFMPEPDTLDRIIQILQYGGAPDAPEKETPAEAESDIPDSEDVEVQPYTWGGSGT